VTPVAPGGRFQQLDALRAVAIGIVMLHHYMNPPILLSGFGVTFLFVLSGYFATNTLLKLRTRMEDGRTEMGGAVKDFYLRRYLRICPMYFIVLLVTALCNIEGARDSLPWNAFFLANIQTVVNQEWNGRFSPMWSLSFLEQFYLIWPFVVLVLPRKRLVPAIIFMMALGPAWRMLCYAQNLSAINWSVFPLSSCDAAGDGQSQGVAPARVGLALDRRAGHRAADVCQGDSPAAVVHGSRDPVCRIAGFCQPLGEGVARVWRADRQIAG
jgi:peptidoglycan/LPS O-acetylase OafA/YrhL